MKDLSDRQQVLELFGLDLQRRDDGLFVDRNAKRAPTGEWVSGLVVALEYAAHEWTLSLSTHLEPRIVKYLRKVPLVALRRKPAKMVEVVGWQFRNSYGSSTASGLGEILYRFHDPFRADDFPDVVQLPAEDSSAQSSGNRRLESERTRFAIMRGGRAVAGCTTQSTDDDVAFASVGVDVPSYSGPEDCSPSVAQVVAAWATSVLNEGAISAWWTVNDHAFEHELLAARDLGASRLYEVMYVEASVPHR